MGLVPSSTSTYFRALCAGFILSRAFYCLPVFPRFLLVLSFPALATAYPLARVCSCFKVFSFFHHQRVFTRFTSCIFFLHLLSVDACFALLSICHAFHFTDFLFSSSCCKTTLTYRAWRKVTFANGDKNNSKNETK